MQSKLNLYWATGLLIIIAVLAWFAMLSNATHAPRDTQVTIQLTQTGTTTPGAPKHTVATAPLLEAPPVYKLEDDKITKANVVIVTNFRRQIIGLPPVRANAYLTQLAQQRADYLASHGKFEHDNVQEQVDKNAYDWNGIGENLAAGFASVTDMQTAWENSPSHYSIISTSYYKDIGVGIATGIYNDVPGTTFVVVLFGLQGKDAGTN